MTQVVGKRLIASSSPKEALVDNVDSVHQYREEGSPLVIALGDSLACLARWRGISVWENFKPHSQSMCISVTKEGERASKQTVTLGYGNCS